MEPLKGAYTQRIERPCHFHFCAMPVFRLISAQVQDTAESGVGTRQSKLEHRSQIISYTEKYLSMQILCLVRRKSK